MRTRRTPLSALALAVVAGVVLAQAPAVKEPPAAADKTPWYIDDNDRLDHFTAKLAELAKAGKCLTPEQVKQKTAEERRCKLDPAKPADKPLAPEDVYRLALPSVFVFGSVVESEDADGGWDTGIVATAWVLAADGVLVTNAHMFDDLGTDRFGAMSPAGDVFAVTDVLALDKTADVAIVKVNGTGFAPLPVAPTPAAVGAWVGVLSHPGNQLYTFTQGHVSRYTKNFGGPEFAGEKWMSVTADYAGGSSGGPVLDRRGAVVGMACLTSNIDFDPGTPPPADDERKKPEEKKKPARRRPDDKKPDAPMLPAESTVQMVVKLAVPAAAVRAAVSGEPKKLTNAGRGDRVAGTR